MATKQELDIFKIKARNALKRKSQFVGFTLSFPSFAKDVDEDGNGEPLEIKFRSLSDQEINDCVDYDSNDPNGGDKFAVYSASVEPSLKSLGMALKDEGILRTPFEIMDMFERHEITEAAKIIMEQSGLLGKNKVTVVGKTIENLKN